MTITREQQKRREVEQREIATPGSPLATIARQITENIADLEKVEGELRALMEKQPETDGEYAELRDKIQVLRFGTAADLRLLGERLYSAYELQITQDMGKRC